MRRESERLHPPTPQEISKTVQQSSHRKERGHSCPLPKPDIRKRARMPALLWRFSTLQNTHLARRLPRTTCGFESRRFCGSILPVNAMNPTVESDQALTEEAFSILRTSLSPHKVARLLSLWQIGKGDYVRERDALFQGETVSSLYEKAVKVAEG